MEKMKLRLMYLKSYFEKYTDEETPKTMKEIVAALVKEGYKADKRTVRQDIDVLINSGMEIISQKEGNSYYYHLSGGTFEIAEIKMLIDTVQSSVLLSEKKAKEIIGKLESLTSENQTKRLAMQNYFANRKNLCVNEQVYYGIDAAYRAIANHKNIEFIYHKWVIKDGKFKQIEHRNGHKYRVSPLALFYNDNKYYMVCYDIDDACLKNFRVDKMTSFSEISNEERKDNEYTDGFDIIEYTDGLFGMYTGEKKLVRIYFPHRLCGVVVDRFGSAANIVQQDEGGFVIEATVQISDQFLSWLCGLGREVRLISPDEAVKAMNIFLDSLKAVYDNSGEGAKI